MRVHCCRFAGRGHPGRRGPYCRSRPAVSRRSQQRLRADQRSFGFYGNIWVQAERGSYMRNLSAQWPQKTPKSLRYPKPSSNYTW